ncbi:MAG: macro domain-containing protein [Polyangiaceae bacterium]
MNEEISLDILSLSAAATKAFEQACDGLPRVRVVEKRWENCPAHDCFVTAANSYGLMSAGTDAAVVARFGREIEQNIQTQILNQYWGEQPIGSAFLVSSGSAWCPWVVHAPTMRMPGDISATENVYQATKAALLAIRAHNCSNDVPIRTVLIPAMGTGFGQMSNEEAARQMAVAWSFFLEPPYPPNWDRAIAREKRIRGR